MIYSSGKVVTALVMAILADRGLIDYEAPIAKYWPEFAASCNGVANCEKARITVQDMMSMSGKIPYLAEKNPIPWDFLHDLGIEHHFLLSQTNQQTEKVKAAIERSPLIDTAIIPLNEAELKIVDEVYSRG